MNFKPEEKVRYIGADKNLKGCIGYVVDIEEISSDLMLDTDEILVDFGVEDECIEIVKKKDLGRAT